MTDSPVLPEVTAGHLASPLRQALGDERAEPTTWSIQPITGGRGLVGGVYRIAGSAQVTQTAVPWSLILKVVSDPQHDHDETGVNYWKREFLAYRDHLLVNLPGGLSAPRCFGAVDYPGQATWLWLEDVQEGGDSAWQIAQYGVSARHLGRFNAAYLLDRPLPVHSWLNRQLVRKWLVHFSSYTEQLPAMLEQPLVRRFCSASDGQRLLQLWNDRDLLLDALDHLPQTFCHHDAIRSNLLASGSGRTVAIDWEFTGIGALGEELGPLVGGTLAMMGAEAHAAQELDEAAFAGYLAGLDDAQWQGNRAGIRFAFAASAAIRFGLVWGVWLTANLGGNGDGLQSVERFYDQPADAIVEHFATVLPWLLDRGDEARHLLQHALSSRQG